MIKSDDEHLVSTNALSQPARTGEDCVLWDATDTSETNKAFKIDKLLEKSQKQMKQGISSRHEPLNMNPRTSGHMSKQIRCEFIMHQKMIIHQKIYTIDEMS